MSFNLLIVDDEAPIRKGLSEHIKWEDYDCKVVATANNGEDAIAKINENVINIILTDVKMPLLDGIGLAKYIYENHPDVAVIILSGYSEFEYARSAIQYHVSQYLLKPASKDQIITAVKEVCEKIVTSKSNTQIKESELAFLKDQLFQQLTDSNIIDENKQKKIDSFNLDFSHFYVAAFQLPKDFNDFMSTYNIPMDEKYLKMLTESPNIFQLKSIVLNMINDLQIQLTHSVRKYSSFIEESLNYIKEHLEDDLSLEQIAQHVHINKSYFSRTFKKECGDSVISYITNLRINKAKELLATSNLKTFEISETVGIHDPAYFSVIFKKNTGMSPKAYRDQFLNV